MKKETFLKILKYFGVACIGAFVGMGALIGVSSCSNQNRSKEETTIKRNLVKHYQVVNSINDFYGKDGVFYFCAKNYSTNGEGVFYQGTINITNSRIVNVTDGHLNQYLLGLNFQYIKDGVFVRDTLRLSTDLNGGVYKLRAVSVGDVLSQTTSIYYADSDGGYFIRSNCAFVAYGPLTSERESEKDILYYNLKALFSIYYLSGQSFKFSEHINYYAPYGQDIDSYYVNDANMVNPSDYVVKTLLEGYPFYSGGYVFDTIRLRYINAMATSYLDENGNRKVWMVSGFANFMFVEYVNTSTNYILAVNDRILSPWQDGNQSGFNQTKNSKWVSDYYRDIQFFTEPSQTLITKLSILNNSSYDGGYTDNSSLNNVGLSNVFDLLRLAFTSWIPIFNIQIIPGITIGLMMFLPLITGIILFIVWLVKR